MLANTYTFKASRSISLSSTAASGSDKSTGNSPDGPPEALIQRLKSWLLVVSGIILFVVLPFLQPTFLWRDTSVNGSQMEKTSTAVITSTQNTAPSKSQLGGVDRSDNAKSSIRGLFSHVRYFSSPVNVKTDGTKSINSMWAICGASLFMLAFAYGLSFLSNVLLTILGTGIKFLRGR